MAKMKGKILKYAEGVISGLSPTEAAIAAGYAPGGPCKSAVFRHSHDPEIEAYIAHCLMINNDIRRRKADVDHVWVTEQFKEIYARCMQGVPVMKYNKETERMEQLTNEEGAGVWTFDAANANKAMENIGKHIGYYEKDNRQRKSVINVGIVVNNNDHQENQKIVHIKPKMVEGDCPDGFGNTD